MEKYIYFTLKINIPEHPNVSEFEFKSKLSFPEDSGQIILEINHEESLNLGYFLSRYSESLEDWSSFPMLFKPKLITSTNLGNNLLSFDFRDSKAISVSFGYTGITNIVLSEISIFHKRQISVNAKKGSDFWLSSPCDEIVRHFYGQSFTYKGKWEVWTRFKKLLPFEDVKYKFYFIYKKTELEKPWQISIRREPNLHISHRLRENPKKVLLYGKVISSIAGLYFHQNIDFEQITIRTEEYTIVVPFSRKAYLENNYYSLIHYGYKKDFSFYLLDINTNNFLTNNYELIIDWIEKFINSITLDEESKFLLLYKLLERMKTEISKSVGVEYKLSIPLNEAKEKLKSILVRETDYVDEAERSFFIDKVVNQAFFKPQKNQFEALFNKLLIDPKDYNVNVKDLHNIRNKVAHGVNNFDRIKPSILFVPNLQKLVGAALLRILGLELSMKDGI